MFVDMGDIADPGLGGGSGRFDQRALLGSGVLGLEGAVFGPGAPTRIMVGSDVSLDAGDSRG